MGERPDQRGRGPSPWTARDPSFRIKRGPEGFQPREKHFQRDRPPKPIRALTPEQYQRRLQATAERLEQERAKERRRREQQKTEELLGKIIERTPRTTRPVERKVWTGPERAKFTQFWHKEKTEARERRTRERQAEARRAKLEAERERRKTEAERQRAEKAKRALVEFDIMDILKEQEEFLGMQED